MSNFNDTLKDLLADLQKFLEGPLAKEKLSKSCKQEKEKLIQKIRAVNESYPASRKLSTDDQRQSVGDELYEEPPLGADEEDAEYEDLPEEDTSRSRPKSLRKQNSSVEEIPHRTAAELKDSSRIKANLQMRKQKKDGVFTKKLEKRWCAVDQPYFYVFDSPKDKKHKLAFEITHGYMVEKSDDIVKKGTFPFDILFEGNKLHQFVAESEGLREEWMDVIFEVIDDVYETYDENIPDEARKPSVKNRRSLPPTKNRESVQSQDIYDMAESSDGKQNVEEIYEDGRSDNTAVRPRDSIQADDKQTTQNVGTVQRRRPPSPKSKPPPSEHLYDPADINYKDLFYGRWDCKAESDDELSFHKGDVITIIRQIGDWWLGELSGKAGLVPRSYLKPVYTVVAA